MSRVLVSGGAGFIGSHLVDALIQRRHRVTVVDNLSCGKKKNVPDQARFFRLDIRSGRLTKLVQQFAPQIVFHLAAQKNIRTSVEKPAEDADVNIRGSLRLLEACRLARVRRVIFSSTGGAIYGPTAQLPTTEEVPPLPESPYAISKLAVEHYLRFYASTYGISTLSLRYANVYGPRQDPQGEAGVVAIFIQRLFSERSFVVYGTGRQTRDFVYVSDVVAANLAALESTVEGSLNIGTGLETSINHLARVIMQQAGIRVHIQRHRARVGEVVRSALDSGRARRCLDWKPIVPLEVGIAATLSWGRRAWPSRSYV